jgi:copper chaperone CopZ
MRIAIDGMHCGACAQRVRKALEKTGGVTLHDVQVGWAEVDVQPGREEAALEAVRKAGFEPRKPE